MSTTAAPETDATRLTSPSARTGTASTPDVPRPTGALPATLPALAVGIVVLGVGVAAIRDAVVTLGWAAGEPWSPQVLEALSTGVKPSTPLIVGGAVLALLGLWFLWRAFGRRPRRDLGLGGDSHAWIAPSHVTRIVTLVASDVDGVVSARCRPKRRSMKVRVVATPAVASTVRSEVRDRVRDAVSGLEPTPRVTVRVSTLESAS